MSDDKSDDVLGYLRTRAFGIGSGPLGLPTNIGEWMGLEKNASEGRGAGPVADAAGGGFGFAMVMLAIIAIVMLVILLSWWAYPLTSVLALVSWHLLTFVLSHLAALIFTDVTWCASPNPIALLPTLLANPTCSEHVPHDLFGYDPWAAFIAGAVVFFATLIFFRPVERGLTHSSLYLSARHAWRCALPGMLFLLYVHSPEHPHSLSRLAQVAIPVTLGVLAHLLFIRLPKITAAVIPAPAAPSPAPYRAGALAAAPLVALYTFAFLGSGAIDWDGHLLPLAGSLGKNQVDSRDYLAAHANELLQVAGQRWEGVATTRDAPIGDCVVAQGTHVEVEVYAYRGFPGVRVHLLGGSCQAYRTVEFPVAALPMDDLLSATLNASEEAHGGRMVKLGAYLHDRAMRQRLRERPGTSFQSAEEFAAGPAPGEPGSGFLCRVRASTPLSFKAYVDNTGTFRGLRERYSAVVSLPEHLCPSMEHQVFIAPMDALPDNLRLQNLKR